MDRSIVEQVVAAAASVIASGAIGGVVEDAAQAAINACGLGGPVAIPADLRAAALQRAMAFAAAGI